MGEGELCCVIVVGEMIKKKQQFSITALLSSLAMHLSCCHTNKARAAPSARGSESSAERSETGGCDRKQGSAGRRRRRRCRRDVMGDGEQRI